MSVPRIALTLPHRMPKATIVAAGITFYTLLAIFPALAAFVSIYGLIADVTAVRDQLQQLAQVFPASAVDLMGQQMMRLATERDSNLSLAALVSLLLSVWSANAGMKTLFDGLNVAYEETEKRNFFIRSALTYAFTLALLAVWFAVTFGVTFFARDLGFMFFGWPFSFWVGAQGALIVYVCIIGFYAWYMNRLDQQHGVAEEE